MIATWMSYTVFVAVLLGVAAAAVERVALAVRRPARFVWCAALAGSLAWPVASLLRPAKADAPVIAPVVTMPFTVVVPDAAAAPDWAARIDYTLTAIWIVASLVLFARLGRALVTLRRTRAAWRRSEVDGVAVQLSSDVGPAVVGLRSMDVVLPEWILSLDRPLRAMVLRHEEEHRAARDPYLLFASGVVVALMPWNVALWWQTRRLRHAIEMDCDARVLRAHPRPDRYGLLLLTMAQRRSTSTAAFAPMLAEPTTQLERRINAMRSPTKLVRLTALIAAATAVASIAVACALQSPDKLVAPSAMATRAAPKAVGTNDTYFEFQVEQPVRPKPGNTAPRYPDMLRAARVEGEVLVQFVADTTGSPDMSTFKILKSTHDLFTASVRATLPSMRFEAARVGGHPVKQLVQMPFQFTLATGDGPAAVVNVPAGSTTPRGPGDTVSVRKLETVHITALPKPLETSTAVLPQPKLLPGTVPPRYPDALRAAHVEGEVVVQFVLDTEGAVMPGSVKVLRSTDELFTATVLETLQTARFVPPELNGKRVHQLVQMPFQFNLSKK